MQLANIPKEWLDDEDTSDPAIYKSLREGDTMNVFQMAKHVPTQMIKDFNVHDINGLNAVDAGNRPGPLAKGEDGKSMVDKYAEAVKSGHIVSIDPRIDSILAETNGQLWYQEQLMALGQIMCGYSLGNADLRIRKVVAKKLKKKIPEIRNEFVYGKQSEYDKDGNVIGLSTEDSPYCSGAIANGFDEAMALKLFKDIEAFAAYCFNKSHSAAYAFVGYRTAWLNYYYPVEWAIACMTLDTIDGKTDNVIATLNNCKKKGIKILPPDINDSDSNFTVAHLPDGTKGIRFGLLAIKGVGTPVLKAVKELRTVDGDFTSFRDFLDRTLGSNDATLRKLVISDEDFYTLKEDANGNMVKSFRNPFKKGNIIPLIQAGAFDSLEENRYKLINEFLMFRNIKKEKENEMLDESEYKLRVKLALELELLGYYVSQHPLDGDVFPYVDLSQAKNGQPIKIAGLVKEFKKNSRPTKSGKTYYKLLLEFKDGTDMWINIWDNIYAKFSSTFKGLNTKAKDGKTIVIVEGKYSINKGYTNINVNSITKVVSSQEELEETEMPDNSEGVPELDAKDSPMDDDLFMKVGGNNA